MITIAGCRIKNKRPVLIDMYAKIGFVKYGRRCSEKLAKNDKPKTFVEIMQFLDVDCDEMFVIFV